MTAPLLLILAALAHLAPELVAETFGHSTAAWAYVTTGTETALLWVAVGLTVRVAPVRIVAAWGAVESALKPACRLAFPMDRPPPRLLPGENLCDAATGQPMGWLSLAVACWVAALVLARSGR